MTKCLVYILTMVLSACSATSTYHGKLTIYELVDHITFNGSHYVIVNLQQLNRSSNLQSLAYVGTEDRFHLLKISSGTTLKMGDIQYFAIKRSFCRVADERLPDDEESYVTETDQRRSVSLIGGECVVRGRFLKKVKIKSSTKWASANNIVDYPR